jgi:endo-1,4-beta-D-glucanase Y
MKRRLFLSGSAAFTAALAGCGGGGGGGTTSIGTSATGTTTTPAVPSSSDAVATPAASPAAQPQAAQQSTTFTGQGYPFGSRLVPYAAGILPTNATPAQMDATIKRCYDAWKANGIVDVPSVPGGKALRFSNNYLMVSEGAGYAMLIAVVMHGYDPQAKAIFDGLLTTVRARPAYSVPNVGRWLHDWRLTADGSSTDAAGGGWNAMDGDQDIALALLMADKQWGSNGAWNYKQEAINTINAMKAWNMHANGTTKGLATSDVSRTSDYMIGHFRAYARATGDAYWSTTVIDRCYWLIDRMQTQFSGRGIMPDFIIQADSSNPIPSPGGRGDFVDTEMHYYANAQRNPWRWGTDYVLSGDERWKNVTDKLMATIKADVGGDPARTPIGYRLDGSPLMRPYPNWTPKGMIGPQLCGAMTGSSHQAYLNALWTYNANNFSTLYYDSELQLIPMLVASGNWWTP